MELPIRIKKVLIPIAIIIVILFIVVVIRYKLWLVIKDMLSSFGGFMTAITPLGLGILAYLQIKNGKKTNKIAIGQDKIVEKVDEYHKEVNGKMEKLIVTTEALGKAKGKAEEKDDQAKRDAG